jgi:hypothetical protein
MCARPTGVGMFAPLTLLRNASRAQSEGCATRRWGKARPEHYKGRSSVGKPRPCERSRCAEHGGVRLQSVRPTGDSHTRTTRAFMLLMSIGIPLENTNTVRGRKANGRANENGKERKQRGQGHYRGWGPTPSFAAARESYPSRGLLQRCYTSTYRG